jgi:hypothetical protein
MKTMNHDFQIEVLNYATMETVAAIDVITARYNLSSLSATTIMLQALVFSLKEYGGAASKPYMNCMVDGAFCTDEHEGQKISARARRYMEVMAANCDLAEREVGPIQ